MKLKYFIKLMTAFLAICLFSPVAAQTDEVAIRIKTDSADLPQIIAGRYPANPFDKSIECLELTITTLGRENLPPSFTIKPPDGIKFRAAWISTH